MYGEYVSILVNGKEINVFVFCVPNMPQDELKRMAIKKYTNKPSIDLLKENGLEE